jgi:hypothetical protein
MSTHANTPWEADIAKALLTEDKAGRIASNIVTMTKIELARSIARRTPARFVEIEWTRRRDCLSQHACKG